MTDRHITYDYDSVPTIQQFSRDNSFIRGLMGPFGSGKSSGCVWDIVRRGLAQKPGPDGRRRTRWGVIRNSYIQLRDTTIQTVHDWLPPALFGEWAKTDHRYTVHIQDADIEFLFRAMDRPDQVSNLLSLELTGAWVNEAREVPWAIIEALTGRVGRWPSQREEGCTWAGIIADTNPPDDDSKWYQFFEERQPANAKLFKQPGARAQGAENLPHLPKNYYEHLAAGKDPDFIRVYVDGEYGFVRDGQPIYEGTWNNYLHTSSESLDPIPGLTVYAGWDFGLTPACVFAQLMPSGQLRILDEVCAERLGIRRFANDEVNSVIADRYQGLDIIHVGDPAGVALSQTDEKSAFEVLDEEGFDVQPSPSNDPTARWESVRWFLTRLIDGKPAFLLSKNCKILRKGFNGGYSLRRLQTAAERYADKADKNMYSHPHDALQYLCQRVKTTKNERPVPVDTIPKVNTMARSSWMGG